MSTSIECPFCKAEVHAEYRECPECGGRLDDDPEQENARLLPDEEPDDSPLDFEMLIEQSYPYPPKQCPRCKAWAASDALVCFCGFGFGF